MSDKCEASNFLRQFRDKDTRKMKNVTAAQFAEVWQHYDTDGNGFIEGAELDGFLREFVSSVVDGECGPELVSEVALQKLKSEFLLAYDEDNDERIEIGEMAQILPTDESFLLLFRRDNPLDSSVEFMKAWKQFDIDRSGFIESNELSSFLHHLLKLEGMDETESTRLAEYTKSILLLFDRNKDGKLQLSEMARLLPVKENYVCRPIFRNANRLSSFDIDRVFRQYDADRNGNIEEVELLGLLKDLLEIAQEDYDNDDLKFFQGVILDQWDVNHDGKIDKSELKMLLLQQSRLAMVESEISSYKNVHRVSH